MCAAAKHTGIRVGQFVAIRGCGSRPRAGLFLPDVWNSALDITIGKRGEPIEIWAGDCWVNLNTCHAILFTDFENVGYTVSVEGYDGCDSLVPKEPEVVAAEPPRTKYRALGDNVAVRMRERPGDAVQLSSGLYAPDVLRKTTNIGTVVSTSDWGSQIVKRGDVVLTFGIHQEAVEENGALVRFHKLHELLAIVHEHE